MSRSCSPRGVPTPISCRIRESEIESAGVNQQALPDIRVAAEIYTTHPARFVEVREGSFQALTTQSHQAQAARIPNSVVHEINRVDRFPT